MKKGKVFLINSVDELDLFVNVYKINECNDYIAKNMYRYYLKRGISIYVYLDGDEFAGYHDKFTDYSSRFYDLYDFKVEMRKYKLNLLL